MRTARALRQFGPMRTRGADLASDAPRTDLSVVVPCFQCRDTIGATLDRLTSYLDTLELTWDVVVVDDGSTDGTADVLRTVADGTRIRPVFLPRNRGKGAAVAAGMLRARGACRIFTDADLPYELNAVERCASRVRAGSPAVFGNRLLDGSDSTAHSRSRRALSGMVRRIVGVFLKRNDIDTQCGLKGFAAPLAEVLFSDLRTEGFLFDVEVAATLVEAGIELDFVPVILVNEGASTVHLIPTALRSLRETWGILRMRKTNAEKIRAVRRAGRSRAPGP